MKAKRKKAAVSTTALKKTQQNKDYHSSPKSLSEKRAEKIAERKRQIPKRYWGIYDKAVTGKSRKAAIHAQCLECCGWQRNEVALCTDFACPLYSYRPYKIPQHSPERLSFAQESTKTGKGDNYAG